MTGDGTMGGVTGEELAARLAFTTAMAFTPGPNATLSTALAANHGLKVALRFVIAVPLGWGLLFTICTIGVGAVVTAMSALRGWLARGHRLLRFSRAMASMLVLAAIWVLRL